MFYKISTCNFTDTLTKDVLNINPASFDRDFVLAYIIICTKIKD